MSEVRALLDVNVLIALFDGSHVHHETARTWLTKNQEHGWASCPLTENGAVRILSTPSYANAVSTAEATAMMAGACATEHHEFWSDEVSIVDGARIRRDRIHGPRQITDVYLLALAVANEGRLVTLDAAVPLSPVVGATKRHLVVIR